MKLSVKWSKLDCMNPYIGGRVWADFITLYDYILLPFALMIVYAFAYQFRNKHYPPKHPWRKFFLPAFTAKIAGGIFIGLIYQYYYSGGDTSAFFYHAKVINQSLGDSFTTWLKLIFHTSDYTQPEVYKYVDQMRWYRDPSTYTVCSITAIINLFTFNTFLPTTVIFSALSFTGYWALFRTFATQYPKLKDSLAVAFLFIPSSIIWGSGIFKDTVCMTALGWLTYFIFKLLIQKKIRLSYIIPVLICAYLLATVKLYILLIFTPSLLLWILFQYSQKINNSGLKIFLKVLVLIGIVFGFLIFARAFAKELGQYSLENIAETSTTTREYLLWVSKESEGSGYDLGPIDPSPIGMLAKFPAAVNVALFRPYLWESRKPIVFFNAIEASLFIFFTLKVLFSIGIGGVINGIKKDPNIQFFLAFTIVFAFAVGISSYNFGALSRYRIPCLNFFAASLVLLFYSKMPAYKTFFKLR